MMNSLAAQVDAMERQNRAALALLREKYGWHPFGAHIDIVDMKLEYFGEDESGLPLFERVVGDEGN